MKGFSSAILLACILVVTGCLHESTRRNACLPGLRGLWVAVAAEDLPAGTVLAPHHVRGKNIPPSEADGCFVGKGLVEQLVGKTLSVDVKAMNPIKTKMIKDTEPEH